MTLQQLHAAVQILGLHMSIETEEGGELLVSLSKTDSDPKQPDSVLGVRVVTFRVSSSAIYLRDEACYDQSFGDAIGALLPQFSRKNLAEYINHMVSPVTKTPVAKPRRVRKTKRHT